MPGTLAGKTAVVTGSSKGIGYAIAEAMAREDANVVVSARNAEEVREAARELDGIGAGRAVGIPCDMRNYDDVKRLIAAADELGGLDVLVNNAGVGGFAPTDEISVEQWETIIGTNLTGVFYACREAIPRLRSRGGGWIINIGSLAGKNPFAGGSAYNASKFGLLGFSEAMMLDVREHGIRVCCVMPGSVDTYFNGKEPKPENALPSRIEVRPTRPKSR